MSSHSSNLIERMKKTLPHRFVSSRPHLTMAIALGVVVALLVPEGVAAMTRALIAWSAAVWTYLLAMMWIMAQADHHKVREIAASQDESAALVLLTLVIAAVFSLSAIFFVLSELAAMPTDERAVHYVLVALTLVGSWMLVGVLFCFHYAHMFFRPSTRGLRLRFPNDEKEPDYWDFMYFSFTIAVAMQTADVKVMTRGMRKLVLGHSVLTFFFNLVILGLSINIAAGVIKT